jgi:hypothetical protein
MASLPTNPWEAYVLQVRDPETREDPQRSSFSGTAVVLIPFLFQNRYPDETEASSSTSTAESDQSSPVKSLVTNPDADPIIYPGLYCPSGFDMMSILVCAS